MIWQNGNANNTTEMNQKFRIEKASGNYYYIKYAKSNQCLDVYNGEMSNETDIIQWPHHGADNQLWQIEKTADGYYTIRSKLNGLYMDVYKCDMSNGTNVQCYQWCQLIMNPRQLYLFVKSVILNQSLWFGVMEGSHGKDSGDWDTEFSRASGRELFLR